MSFLLILLVIILNYLFLRANGVRDGSTLRVQFPPASTPAGKKSRTAGFLVLAFSLAVFAIVITGQSPTDRVSVIAPFLAGAGVFLVFYLTKKN